MTSAETCVVPLQGLILPESLGLQRDHTRPPARRTEHYLDRYDRLTLFYDCVRDSIRPVFVLSAPRFLNFWDHFRSGLRINGNPATNLRRRTWLRTEQIDIPAPPDAELTVEIMGKTFPIPTRAALSDRFSGLDCLMAVNKNNRLNWLTDWAAVHARLHGTNAVVLFDNGSTDYTPQEAADAIAAADGVARVTLVSAPYKYGPSDRSGRFDVSPRFFQTGMFNIARRDFCARANGVLSVDIDEVVRTKNDRSIYEMARAHPLGLVSFRGMGVYPAEDTGAPQDHLAHTRLKTDAGKGNTKWCISPGGFMNRFGWAVHRFGGAFFPLTTTAKAEFFHFRAVTTNWNTNRLGPISSLRHSDDLAGFMAANFPADRTGDTQVAS